MRKFTKTFLLLAASLPICGLSVIETAQANQVAQQQTLSAKQIRQNLLDVQHKLLQNNSSSDNIMNLQMNIANFLMNLPQRSMPDHTQQIQYQALMQQANGLGINTAGMAYQGMSANMTSNATNTPTINTQLQASKAASLGKPTQSSDNQSVGHTFTQSVVKGSEDNLNNTLSVKNLDSASSVQNLAQSVQSHDFNAKQIAQDKFNTLETSEENTISDAADQAIKQEAFNILPGLKKIDTTFNVLNTANHDDGTNPYLRMLFSLYGNKQGNKELFLEPGYIYYYGHHTGNLGLGWRQLLDNKSIFYGINLFDDYDFTGKNDRASIGGELGIQDLSLHSNYYHALTGWKVAPETNMFEEKPANGFDIGVTGQLPIYPALSADITYSKWQGNVDLYNTNNNEDFQNNPYTLDMSLNYNPIPLVGLQYSYTKASGDQNNNQIQLKLSYNLDEPFIDQISMKHSKAQYSLAADMLKMVNRSYGIVLDKELNQPQLLLNSIYTFQADTKNVNIKVTTKSNGYTVDHYQWSGLSSLGSYTVDPSNGELTITQLPSYGAAAHTFPLTLTAHYYKGTYTDATPTLQKTTTINITPNAQKNAQLNLSGLNATNGVVNLAEGISQESDVKAAVHAVETGANVHDYQIQATNVQRGFDELQVTDTTRDISEAKYFNFAVDGQTQTIKNGVLHVSLPAAACNAQNVCTINFTYDRTPPTNDNNEILRSDVLKITAIDKQAVPSSTATVTFQLNAVSPGKDSGFTVPGTDPIVAGTPFTINANVVDGNNQPISGLSPSQFAFETQEQPSLFSNHAAVPLLNSDITVTKVTPSTAAGSNYILTAVENKAANVTITKMNIIHGTGSSNVQPSGTPPTVKVTSGQPTQVNWLIAYSKLNNPTSAPLDNDSENSGINAVFFLSDKVGNALPVSAPSDFTVTVTKDGQPVSGGEVSSVTAIENSQYKDKIAATDNMYFVTLTPPYNAGSIGQYTFNVTEKQDQNTYKSGPLTVTITSDIDANKSTATWTDVTTKQSINTDTPIPNGDQVQAKIQFNNAKGSALTRELGQAELNQIKVIENPDSAQPTQLPDADVTIKPEANGIVDVQFSAGKSTDASASKFIIQYQATQAVDGQVSNTNIGDSIQTKQAQDTIVDPATSSFVLDQTALVVGSTNTMKLYLNNAECTGTPNQCNSIENINIQDVTITDSNSKPLPDYTLTKLTYVPASGSTKAYYTASYTVPQKVSAQAQTLYVSVNSNNAEQLINANGNHQVTLSPSVIHTVTATTTTDNQALTSNDVVSLSLTDQYGNPTNIAAINGANSTPIKPSDITASATNEEKQTLIGAVSAVAGPLGSYNVTFTPPSQADSSYAGTYTADIKVNVNGQSLSPATEPQFSFNQPVVPDTIQYMPFVSFELSSSQTVESNKYEFAQQVIQALTTGIYYKDFANQENPETILPHNLSNLNVVNKPDSGTLNAIEVADGPALSGTLINNNIFSITFSSGAKNELKFWITRNLNEFSAIVAHFPFSAGLASSYSGFIYALQTLYNTNGVATPLSYGIKNYKKAMVIAFTDGRDDFSSATQAVPVCTTAKSTLKSQGIDFQANWVQLPGVSGDAPPVNKNFLPDCFSENYQVAGVTSYKPNVYQGLIKKGDYSETGVKAAAEYLYNQILALGNGN